MPSNSIHLRRQIRYALETDVEVVRVAASVKVRHVERGVAESQRWKVWRAVLGCAIKRRAARPQLRVSAFARTCPLGLAISALSTTPYQPSHRHA